MRRVAYFPVVAFVEPQGVKFPLALCILADKKVGFHYLYHIRFYASQTDGTYLTAKVQV